jgi:hypothetical protein
MLESEARAKTCYRTAAPLLTANAAPCRVRRMAFRRGEEPSMQLREMRFARIDGTEVLVEVKSEQEAKSAIKELRHKKKELALLKRRIVKQEVRARRTIERAEEAADREARKRGLFATLRRVSRVFRKGDALPDLDSIQGEIEKTDEILHNIDSCIIQLEGRLLG